ncbi:hypothetical protein J2X41_004468 [Caulobacter sp. BE254]|nr:hypothetical protein [Caulobacter sp. BE254]
MAEKMLGIIKGLHGKGERGCDVLSRATKK